MSEEIVEAEDSDEETGRYRIVEAFATRTASCRNAPWQCKKCKWQRRCSPPKVLAHLSGTKGYEVPPCAGGFTTEERAALSAAMKSRTSKNVAIKKAARRTQGHTARVTRDEEIKETEAEDHASVRRSPRWKQLHLDLESFFKMCHPLICLMRLFDGTKPTIGMVYPHFAQVQDLLQQFINGSTHRTSLCTKNM
eukprot:363896-Chlamydomonas_euryale.AAC.4